jgi:hypothetical protein
MSTRQNSARVSIPSAIAVEETRNHKTGKVSVTMASQSSCPSTCPFVASGCYAESGPQSWTTAKLNRSRITDPVTIAREEAKAIGTLSGTRPLRLHVVGDCTSDESARILARAVKAYKRRGNQPAWTYTHAWRDISRCSFGSISALASCESTEQVKTASAKGYAAVLVVDRFESEKAYTTADDIKIVPCPQQTGRTENCATCKLCWDDARLREMRVTVGFAAHGAQASAVRRQLVQITEAK